MAKNSPAMPKIVPTKNIDPILVDVRRPGGNYRPRQRLVNLAGLTPPPLVLYRHSRFGFVIVSAVVIFALATGGFLGIINFNQLGASLKSTIDSILSNFSFSVQSLKDFKPDEAVQHLRENDRLLGGLEETLNRYGGLKIITILGQLVPDFKEADGLLKSVRDLNRTVLQASELLNDLKLNGFGYFQSDGPTLIAKLKKMKMFLGEAVVKAEAIQNSASVLKNLSPAFNQLNNLISQQYLSHNSELYRWENFLGALISFLDRPEDVHLALFFQNPSEIRPAGGFIGSYADITLRNGQLYFIDVRDIYDPEGQLDLRTIPPLPLQVTSHIWGARDANWFFDFPTSAAKVAYFLESSKLYKEQGIVFEAAVAINLDVFESVMAVVGPITLEGGLTIDAANVSRTLRQEIEAAKAAGATYPKQILRRLTPVVLERLQNLESGQQEKFAEAVLGHLTRKDIMFYAKSKPLQEFFVGQNIGGAVYGLPHNFFGTYLAVVNANIEGGKSDAFIEQAVDVEVTVDTNGNSFNNVTVERSHGGDKERELWWRKANQNYLQIFTNPGASLVSVKGSTRRPSNYRDVNYQALGYTADGDVDVLERGNVFNTAYQTWAGKAFGKTVFGTWFTVPAGQTKSLEVRYQAPPPVSTALAAGKIYQLVYEKQSGVSGRLNLKINAPFGYVWQESGTPVFTQTFEPDAVPGRLIFSLTLQKT